MDLGTYAVKIKGRGGYRKRGIKEERDKGREGEGNNSTVKCRILPNKR
ncbi:hypothetical protein [Methanosarcina sp. UBA5]|nr:hypothetical protein [Methanosarcina sp. UBA5]